VLRLLDEVLESMLRDRVPLAEPEVGVAFDAPNAEWSASLIRPTVNLFLWAVGPSDSGGEAGMAVYEENGRKVRRPPHPRLQCSYLVTAWTTDVADEHQLLGSMLAVVLKEPKVATTFLPPGRSDIEPPVTVALAREARGADFWSAVGGRLKVGLDLTVTAAMDASAVQAVGPPTTAYEARILAGAGASARRVVGGTAPGAAPGTLVRTARGVGTVDPSGRFVVPGRPGDVVVVESDPPRQSVVDDDGTVSVN
jgi:hypothetical protein